MFIHQQAKNTKKSSNYDTSQIPQAKSQTQKKQNLISQLQNNQNQSMLFRLHQQQVSPNNTGGNEEQQNEQIHSKKASLNYQTMQTNNMNRTQGQMSQVGGSPPSKLNPNRGGVNGNASTQMKNQGTYNQNRMMKQQMDGDNYYTQQSHYQKAPPIQIANPQVVPTPQQKKLKKESKSNMNNNNLLGSQERLMNQYQTSKQTITNTQPRQSTSGTLHSNSKDNLVRQSMQKQQSATNKQVAGMSAKNAQNQNLSIQHPHFIKVKSKTNANPTRQSSPRFAQKSSIQHNRTAIRESTSSYHNQGSKKNQQVSKNQMIMQSSKGYQVMSQPTSPNKDSILEQHQNDPTNRIGYAASLIEPSMNVQFMDQNAIQQANQNMANSMGHGNMSAMSSNNGAGYKKNPKYKNVTADGNQGITVTEVSSTHKSSSRPMKPQSSSNVNYKTTNPSNAGNEKGVRTSKQGSRHESATNYSKQRIQSGNSSKGQQAFSNTMRRLNSPGNNLSIANKMAQMSQIENIEQQQRKQLNQMVTKNIGGIASGSHRRENRNKMMKMQVNNQQVPGCKSVVGSMGSLTQFMGIDPHTQQEMDYHQMKQMEYDNKTQDPNNVQKMQYSQLQQMHLNNVNPMFFSTGEVIQGSQVMNSFNKNSVVGNVGGQTMAIPPRQKQNSSNQGSMINFKQDQIEDNVYNTANGQQYWSHLEHSNGKQQNINKQANNSTGQQTGPVQVKQSMIQMRKINPISKTAANGSQNTSFDQKKSGSKQSSGPQTMKGSYKQKSQFDVIQEHQMQKRQIPQTTKVSYNNSPQNRSKVNSMNIPPNKQGSSKQQQIGQPIGDNIPLISQYYQFKNKDGKMTQQDIINQNEQMKKQSAQVAQSMLIRETKANKRQHSGITVQQSSQEAAKYNELLKSKGLTTNVSQERHTNNKVNSHLIQGGKVKLKIMSESSSPNPNLGGPVQIQNQLMNQYFMQNKHKYAQIDSPKDSSIERVRQFDIIGQESMINNTNIELGTYVSQENLGQNDTQLSQKGNQVTMTSIKKETKDKAQPEEQKKLKLVTNYIIDKIEKGSYDNLSPRSKEVFMIVQLIKNCFAKYNKAPKTQLELYKIGKMLGKGAFGKVTLGLHRLTRKLVAIKSINMDFMKEESQKKKIMNEINILKSLRHPNNIKILETFQTDKHHMIVMELCPGGDLLNYVRKRRKLSEKYAKFVFKQIMLGIAYLHANKVSHRDIKLDNILLDGHGNIKLGDFGVSRKIEENEVLFEQCGTPAYIAPEIVKDMGYKGFPVDIWSAGICLYAMLYGNVPFKANQIGDLNTIEQLNQEIEYKKDVVSAEAISLMKIMLQKSPQKRATAEDVLAHDWLNDDQDEHIDIFDEQELELIRKEFTYVVQRKKLKDLAAQQEELQHGELPIFQASRKPDDLNTEFTQCSLQTHENTLMKNDSVRSVILCPFNTQTGDKTADKILEAAAELMADKDLMVRFHPRVRELDRNYEKLNNQDFDNGVYHKYAYKQKGKKDGKQDDIREEEIRQSDVKMNNLVSDVNQETIRRRKRQNADINYQNYYIKINHKIITDVTRLGFPREFVEKQLRDNANNHCTTTYYLLCMDQNF